MELFKLSEYFASYRKKFLGLGLFPDLCVQDREGPLITYATKDAWMHLTEMCPSMETYVVVTSQYIMEQIEKRSLGYGYVFLLPQSLATGKRQCSTVITLTGVSLPILPKERTFALWSYFKGTQAMRRGVRRSKRLREPFKSSSVYQAQTKHT